MVKVKIAGTDKVLEAPEGADLLGALQLAGHPISTSCGGRASCGLCRLTVRRGMSQLSPLRPEEVHHLGNVAKVIGMRLACQAQVCAGAGAAGSADIEVDVPVVDNIELRKRNKAERMARQRAQQRGAGDVARPSGSLRDPVRDAGREAPREAVREMARKVEWRPRKLDVPGDGKG